MSNSNSKMQIDGSRINVYTEDRYAYEDDSYMKSPKVDLELDSSIQREKSIDIPIDTDSKEAVKKPEMKTISNDASI